MIRKPFELVSISSLLSSPESFHSRDVQIFGIYIDKAEHPLATKRDLLILSPLVTLDCMKSNKTNNNSTIPIRILVSIESVSTFVYHSIEKLKNYPVHVLGRVRTSNGHTVSSIEIEAYTVSPVEELSDVKNAEEFETAVRGREDFFNDLRRVTLQPTLSLHCW